jgi:hypothetical protein
MKRDVAKVSAQSVGALFKLNLLLLIVQFIILHEDVNSRTATARTDHPYKLPNLNNGIQHQLVQLNSKFLQDLLQHRVRRHVKPHRK